MSEAPRIEVPEGIPPEDKAAIRRALERYLEGLENRVSPWALAGRVAATRQGGLQVRRQDARTWNHVAVLGFARRGTEPLMGRGDAK